MLAVVSIISGSLVVGGLVGYGLRTYIAFLEMRILRDDLERKHRAATQELPNLRIEMKHEEIKGSLKPCPVFACHGKPVLETIKGMNPHIWVTYVCSKCHVRTPVSEGAAQAAYWWNLIAVCGSEVTRTAKAEANAAATT